MSREGLEVKFLTNLIPGNSIDNIAKIKPYLAQRDGNDRILPKARVIEVIYLGVVTNFSLFRTEGTSTIDTVELPKSKLTTPVIMPQKIVAIARRKLTELLRRYSKLEPDKMKKYICDALKLKYIKPVMHLNINLPQGFDYNNIANIEVNDNEVKITYEKGRNKNEKQHYSCSSIPQVSWDCWIQPPIEQGTDLGMDTYCPACVIFGAVLTNRDNIHLNSAGGSLNVGIKSRIAMDPAFSLYPRYEFRTHQKVAEGTLSNTGMSLYKEPHMIPGSLVIGKMAFYDVTEAEMVAVLQALISAYRQGGRQSRYGGLEVYPIALSAGSFERISALSLAEALVSEEVKPLDEAVEATLGRLDNRFIRLVEPSNGYQFVFRNKLLSILDDESQFKSLYAELWEDAIEFDRALVDRIIQLKSS